MLVTTESGHGRDPSHACVRQGWGGQPDPACSSGEKHGWPSELRVLITTSCCALSCRTGTSAFRTLSILQLVDAGQTLLAAHLQARLGRVEAEDSYLSASTPTTATKCYAAAIAAFDAAEELLGEQIAELDEEESDLWLEVQVDGRANLHYWWNEPERGADVLVRARPVVEARGSRARQATFHHQLANQRAWEARHRIDEKMLARARAAVSAAQQGVDEYDLAVHVMNVGLLLLWHGDLAEAQKELEAPLVIWEHIGDTLFCLSYLNVAALRRHDVEAVRSLSQQVLAAAQASGHRIHVTLAKATMAWLAWRDGRPADVVTTANEALALWDAAVVVLSVQTALPLAPDSGPAGGRSGRRGG